ncbi:MAG: RNA-binding protein [Gammaproteobacteria bacterium]|nr:RNA-binding protein [Gammaproteobacteria bacterium]
MDIFIQHLPRTILPEDLCEFISRGLAMPKCNGLSIPKNGLLHIDIIEIFDTSKEIIERHGIVELESRSMACKLVNILDGTLLSSQTVAVRPYFVRSISRDRRLLHITNLPFDLLEKRAIDRRRSGLRIKHIDCFAAHN